MIQPAPADYLHGLYFARVRERFEVCGVCVEKEGYEKLILKCLGCSGSLDYTWLVKKPEEKWTGAFGKQLKYHLLRNRAQKNVNIKLH